MMQTTKDEADPMSRPADWQGFWSVLEKTVVPNDFLSASERQIACRDEKSDVVRDSLGLLDPLD